MLMNHTLGSKGTQSVGCDLMQSINDACASSQQPAAIRRILGDIFNRDAQYCSCRSII